VVDKSRAWLHCVELLLQRVPEAKVVVCVREPGQVCCFTEAQQAVRRKDSMARWWDAWRKSTAPAAGFATCIIRNGRASARLPPETGAAVLIPLAAPPLARYCPRRSRQCLFSSPHSSPPTARSDRL